eukprot:3238782-Amphidinium_carterae.1
MYTCDLQQLARARCAEKLERNMAIAVGLAATNVAPDFCPPQRCRTGSPRAYEQSGLWPQTY